MKKTFEIAVSYQMYGSIKVEAEDLEEAIRIAEEDSEVGLPDNADYVDGSWEVDRDVSEELRDFNENR